VGPGWHSVFLCGLRAQLRERVQWKPETRSAARSIISILEHETAAMRLGDLPAQDQPDA